MRSILMHCHTWYDFRSFPYTGAKMKYRFEYEIHFDLFARSRIVTSPFGQITARELNAAVAEWVRTNGIFPIASQVISRGVRRHGGERIRRASGVVYRGVELASPDWDGAYVPFRDFVAAYPCETEADRRFAEWYASAQPLPTPVVVAVMVQQASIPLRMDRPAQDAGRAMWKAYDDAMLEAGVAARRGEG